MSTENVKDPRTFALWKEFLPKEHWEKTVRPLKEEERKTELAAWFLLYRIKDTSLLEQFSYIVIAMAIDFFSTNRPLPCVNHWHRVLEICNKHPHMLLI